MNLVKKKKKLELTTETLAVLLNGRFKSKQVKWPLYCGFGIIIFLVKIDT